MEVQQTYEAEQAKLRRDQGETPTKEDLHVEAPRMPEVHPEVWKDVEPLLFRGFVYVGAEINGVPFAFKSLNHHEFELLRLTEIMETASRQAIRRQYSVFLAYGVFMVDGINVLADRDQWIPEIADLFDNLTDGARERVIRHMSEINRRANRAVVLTEAFAMEPYSRLRWAQCKGLDLTGTAITGVRGTSMLGMNWGQLAWRALNVFEDRKEVAEREWENAKFVASAMAGKGMSKVHAQDKARRERERDERFTRRDKVLRSGLLEEDPDEPSGPGPVVTVARSVEELADQLERDLKGDKDWHDRVVESHENRVREEFAERAQHVQSLRERNAEVFGQNSLVGGTDMAGLTDAEVKFRIARRRQLQAQRLASQQTLPEYTDPKFAEFARKWGKLPTSDRDPADVPPAIVTHRSSWGKPFKRGDD